MDQLERFVEAQHTDYPKALNEIRQGRKQSHWMWYIFPQLKELGKTDIARFYGIADLKEATAYLNHPVLGKRLIEISEALLELKSNDALAIMGKPDNLKLRSCMTIFNETDGSHAVFKKVLDKFYNGQPDDLTIQLLSGKQI